MAQRWPAAVSWLEGHQVACCLGAIVAGVAVGLAAPDTGRALEEAINPILGALLFVTFLQVPVAELVSSLRDGRFLGATLVVNFVVVPIVVAGMFFLLPADRGIRLGVLLVLLAPCVDYVIVFCGLAGGSNRRLLAATPVLLLAQLILLPALLLLFLGSDLSRMVATGPFVNAFLTLIVLPLALAWAVQIWGDRRSTGAAVRRGFGTAMVPLLAATLLVVVASQVPKLDGNFDAAGRVAPFYVGFLVVMAFAGRAVAHAFRLTVPESRAIVFTGATRNSLVVLPLALALPDQLAIAAVVIVTQTLVEVIGMVVYVRLIPRLLPTR